MPQPCSVCTHPEREQVDAALRTGTTYRIVAERFRLSMGALSRHRAHKRTAPGAPGWQRPPFEPGHELSMRHGAHSSRRVDPIATRLVEEVLAAPGCDYLDAARWLPALWAWARAEAQVQLLDAYLAKHGKETRDGVGDLADDKVKAAYLLLHRAEARAARERQRLGLDPLSRARLGRDVTAAHVDMARLLSGMREPTTEGAAG